MGLALYVGAYDAWALARRRETLSGAFARAVRHPATRWPVIAAWLYVTYHLFSGEWT